MAESDRRPTVLVIDDEPRVREVTRRAMEPDVSVVDAADGDDGLALLDQPQTDVDLVVTDFMMPRVSGLAVIAVLARYRPEFPIIGMTGHTAPVLWEVAAKFGVRVLEKPFDISVLVAIVREVLAETRERRRIEGGRQVRAGVRPPPGASSRLRGAGAPGRGMSGHHIGRLGHRGFVLRHCEPGVAGSVIGVPGSYWEIVFEGRIFPWRPVHPGDEADLPQLIRTAIAYLKGELHRSQ